MIAGIWRGQGAATSPTWWTGVGLIRKQTSYGQSTTTSLLHFRSLTFSTQDKKGQHFYLTSKNPIQAKWNCRITQSAKLENEVSRSETVTTQKDAAVCTQWGRVTLRSPRPLNKVSWDRPSSRRKNGDFLSHDIALNLERMKFQQNCIFCSCLGCFIFIQFFI